MALSFSLAIYVRLLIDIKPPFTDSYLAKRGYVEANVCSHDGKNCAVFTTVEYVPCDPMPTLCDSYNIAHLEVRNQLNHHYAKIDFPIGIEDRDFDKSRVEWTHDDQLDIYIENKPSDKVTNYFFKGLGNIKVIFHGTEYHDEW